MQKRKSNASDFDDWDLLEEFPEEKKTPKPEVTPPEPMEDWAAYTAEERKAKRKTGSEGNRPPRRRRNTGSGIKKYLIIVAALAAAVVLITGVGGGEPEKPSDPADQIMESTASLVPEQTIAILPPVVTEPVYETEATPENTIPLVTEPAYVETVPVVTEPPYVPTREYRFYGNELSDMEKRAYDMISDAFFAQQSRVEGIKLLSVDSLFRVTQAIMYDHAELYWYSGHYTYWTTEMDGYMEFALEPTYDCTPEERMQMQELVESSIRGTLDELYWKSDYEKVRGVYEFLIDYSAYDYAYTGKSLYELFRDGRAVCAAYARATQYMLMRMGVETIYVVGEGGTPGDTESHAWNIVKVDGDYYQLDTTWGDPYYEDGTQEKSFKYLLVTDAEMSLEHWPERQGFPPCTATACNYFVYEGRFLNYYDTELLKKLIREYATTGNPMEFKMANGQLYQEVKTRLFDNEELFALMEEVLGEAKAYTFWTDDQFYIIKITW